MGFFEKIKEGLKKTRDALFGRIDQLLKSFTKIDDELFEELEELLVMGDVGMYTADKICNELKQRVKNEGITDPQEIRRLLEEVVTEMLKGGQELDISTKPSVILVIGVNGVGKTTTIGKLAAKFIRQGKKVTLAAADTFRAAAIDQLQIWAERSGADIIKQNEGSDPAAVVFDAISSAKARGSDIIIADTAGRLHNKKNLMNELAKINRIIDRELPDAAKEVLLVLDATTGQNAVNQTKEFKNAAGITGIVLTKLDGTAKGGVVLAIKEELDVPVKFIGVGEQIDDLQPFDPEEFARALFADEEQLSEEIAAETVENTEAAEEEDDKADPLRPSTADIWAQIDAEAEAEKAAEEELKKQQPQQTEEEKLAAETAEKEKLEQEKKQRSEERKSKAKSKYNWNAEPQESETEDDDWLKQWREGNGGE
ncbi:MAG: signal recognition particle-docking protein FtsY [Clostridia bacterium]|nr:signal recognition particle-docking protein FtsY [Clostridia bacterium]